MASEPTSRGMSSMNDDGRNVWVWIERWQRGIDREENFRKIFQAYYRRIYVLFAKRGFDDIECEDLAQETFLRVHRNLASFRGDSKFDTWLWEIAMNVYKNTLRSRGTQKRDAQEVSLDESEADSAAGSGSAMALESRERDPLADLLVVERKQKLHEAMKSLPPQMRRCVELRVHDDLKYREIAELMHVSIDTVKAHLFQARQILKTKLDPFTDQ
jgi:RNA polymerase sigma-70 factor (ECF subfamily)